MKNMGYICKRKQNTILFMKVPMGAARLRISAFPVTNQ